MPQISAGAAGVAAARASNSSASVPSGTGVTVPRPAASSSSRSAGTVTGSWRSRRAGSSTAAVSSRVSRPASRCAVSWSNRSVAYCTCPVSPPRSRPAGLVSTLIVRSNLAAPAATVARLGMQPCHRRHARRAVLEHQQHLEQRVVRQRPVRVDRLHHPLERHVLAGVGGQVGVPDPVQQSGEVRVAAGVGAQHQRVDEQADQAVKLGTGAAAGLAYRSARRCRRPAASAARQARPARP